jgi:hypothetical protein
MPDLEQDNGGSTPDQQQPASPATQDASSNLPLRPSDPGMQLTPQQQPSAQPQQPASPADATAAHHGILGKVAERLFTGSHTEYSIDPGTGATVPTAVKESPGSLFRHILAGAILGGAAASAQPADNEHGVVSGFMTGAAAGMNGQQQQDQQRRANAEQEFQNKQGVRKLNEQDQKISDARTRFDAQNAHWMMREIALDRTANHQGLDFLQRQNTISLRKLAADEKAGGLVAPIKDNDTPGNGKAMQELFTKDPSQFKAPNGYSLSVTKEHDLADLTYDRSKNGWQDEKGNPADLADHTTWHVRFVPQVAVNHPDNYSGRELNRLFPHVFGGRLDPEKNYPLSVKDFTGVATRESEINQQEFEDDFKQTHEKIGNALREGKNRLASLQAQYNAVMKGPVPDEARAAEIQGQIDELNDQIESNIQAADPHLRQHARDYVNAPLPAPVAPGQVAPANPTPKPSSLGKPLVTPPKKGAPLTPALVDKYIAANGGDKAKARSAALADGWTIPQAK